METLQSFLLFLIQFIFIFGISVTIIAFVEYVIPSEQFQLSESLPPLTIPENNSDLIPETSIVDTAEKPSNLVELLCMDEEAIQQTIQTHLSTIAPSVETIERSEDLLCIDISHITLRQARKIAKTLDIKQKVNGKDQPKTWLIKQIEQKLKEQPESAEIIASVLAA